MSIVLRISSPSRQREDHEALAIPVDPQDDRKLQGGERPIPQAAQILDDADEAIVEKWNPLRQGRSEKPKPGNIGFIDSVVAKPDAKRDEKGLARSLDLVADLGETLDILALADVFEKRGDLTAKRQGEMQRIATLFLPFEEGRGEYAARNRQEAADNDGRKLDDCITVHTLASVRAPVWVVIVLWESQPAKSFRSIASPLALPLSHASCGRQHHFGCMHHENSQVADTVIPPQACAAVMHRNAHLPG